jgi:hypothetical protein
MFADIGFRNLWLTLVIAGLPILAAEKKRDWQTGQVVESKTEQSTYAWGPILNQRTAVVDREVHTIESTDRDYLITGFTGGRKQPLKVGMPVRFAVQSKTMFLSLNGKEFRVYILQESMAGNSLIPPTSGPALMSQGAREFVDGKEPLDNDAIVKMVVGGLREDTILKVIDVREGRYATTPEAVLALRAAGVPQRVIAAMSSKMAN